MEEGVRESCLEGVMLRSGSAGAEKDKSQTRETAYSKAQRGRVGSRKERFCEIL